MLDTITIAPEFVGVARIGILQMDGVRVSESPKELKDMLDQLAAECAAKYKDQPLGEISTVRKIRAIFVESSVPQRTIEAVQMAVRARGFDVKIGGQLFSDAMGNAGTPEGTYIGMVRHNIDTIVNALAA